MEYLRANRSSLVLYLLLTLLVIALFLDGNSTFESIERTVQDSMFRFRGTQPVSGTVQICALDDATLDSIGWPMDRFAVARLIHGLKLSGAAAIVCDFDWRNVKTADSAWVDSLLFQTLWGYDRVVLPVDFTYANLSATVLPPPKEYRRSTWTERFPQGAAVSAQAFSGPEPFLADSASGLGAITPMLDGDRVVRWAPLLVDYAGFPFASAALWGASLHDDVGRTSWWLEPGESIKMGNRQIPIDEHGRMLLNYYGPPGTFPRVSAREFLTVMEPNSRLKGKVVVVGPTGYQGTIRLQSRTTTDFPAVEIMATAIENITHGDFVRRSSYSVLFDLLVLGLIGLFCAVLLPKISLLYRFVVLGISLFVLVNLQYLLFASFGLLTAAFYPTLEIVFFMAVSPFISTGKDREATQRRRPPAHTPATQSGQVYTDAHHPSTEPAYPGQATEYQKTVAADGDVDPSGTYRMIDASGTVQMPPNEPSGAVSDESRQMPTTTMPNTTPPSGTVETPASGQDATPTPSSGLPTPTPDQGASPSAAGSGPTQDAPPDGQQASGSMDIKLLGRYQVQEEIGRGAMGIVYKGIDPAINRPVALKTVRLDLAVPPDEKEELRGRLLREAQAAGQLSHPNIVTIYDVGSQGDIHYIAMEYLRGYTLERAVVKKMSLNYKIFAKLMIQVCDALEYAHSNDLVHRDIKPANIMVLDNFKVKVMDFGIARVAHSNMTQTGIALGTPSYISPEQLSGHGVDRRSDIFSLGVVMYEILCKEKPFAGESINKLIFSILNDQPRRLTDHDKSIPDALNLACLKALEKDPTKRYQYASDLSRDLKEFVASLAPQRLTL